MADRGQGRTASKHWVAHREQRPLGIRPVRVIRHRTAPLDSFTWSLSTRCIGCRSAAGRTGAASASPKLQPCRGRDVAMALPPGQGNVESMMGPSHWLQPVGRGFRPDRCRLSRSTAQSEIGRIHSACTAGDDVPPCGLVARDLVEVVYRLSMTKSALLRSRSRPGKLKSSIDVRWFTKSRRCDPRQLDRGGRRW